MAAPLFLTDHEFIKTFVVIIHLFLLGPTINSKISFPKCKVQKVTVIKAKQD